MPKVLHDAVDKMKCEGMPEKKAWPVATAALQKAGKLPKKAKIKTKRKAKGRAKLGKPYYGS